jgi:voltage-gated potassium channel
LTQAAASGKLAYCSEGRLSSVTKEITRRRIHQILEAGIGHEPVATLVNLSIIILILINVVAFAAITVPSIANAYWTWFVALEAVSVAVFSVEYGLRIWSCVELPFYTGMAPWRVRLEFASRPMQIVDLLAILPAALTLFFPVDFAGLLVLRLFRFLKIARYSTALHSLGRVLREERGALFGTLVVMVTLVLFSATGMYFIERDVQPDRFGTIPDAMWWSVVTLGTIGYGDAVPITPLGKMFGAVVIILGLGTFALPIAIIATGFSHEVARREFVVTWSLVARVPLFAGLDGAAVAQIMTLLYAQTWDEGDTIVHRGDPATAMFFITFGDVVVEHEDGDVRLGEGEFFGERALLEHRTVGHTVIAASRCRCLVLERDDFERLARRHPEIGRRVRQVASHRSDPVGSSPR